jgi:hypothetical protein
MMPKINRLTGRFFAVLISLSVAICLPRVAFAGGSTKAPAPTLCQISDTVYRADGSPAQGTVLVSWQAFTTSAGQAVSPGSLLVTLDAQGGFNASLAPNTGASPAGSYYRAIFKLDDGTTETEIWVVPNTQTTTIGAIRSKLVPAQQAAQFLTRDFADSTYVSLASTQTITGVKTFSASPAVPTPQNPTDAANKSYVDNNAGGGNLSSPPPIGNTTPNSGAFTTLTAADTRSANFPVMDLRDYGLVGDTQVLWNNCSIASGQKVLTCTGSSFVSSDVGKGAWLSGAGASGGFLNTTIASYQSSTQVTLAAAAFTTVTNGGPLWYGTDNTAAWCAAMNCNSPAVPNRSYTPQPGRTVRLPRGTYAITGSAYTRNGDILEGDGGTATEVMQFNTTNADLLYVGSYNNSGTPTLDSGGLLNVVRGITFAQPEPTSGACVNTNGGAGDDLIDNWAFCNIAFKITGSPIRLIRNTCDLNTGVCVSITGNGSPTNNPTHSILVESTDCYANRYGCFQVDGASDVLIHHNFVNYAKQFGLFLASPTNQSSYRVVVTGNSFITSTSANYYTNTQTHIYMSTPCVDCQISDGNKFMLSRQYDIDLENTGITGLKIMGNQSYGGQGTSLNVGQAGPGLTLQNNNFDSPGSYAADFGARAVVSGNWCHNPFAVAGLPANDYDKACFRFANTNAAGSKASDNVTDSSSVAAVAFRAGAFPAFSSGNRSGWATADVYVNTGAGSAVASANERVYNGTGVTSVFTTMSDPSTGNAGFAGAGSFGGNLTVGGDLTARDIPGAEYFVSKYAGIQAAINAAYNNGAVLGTVIDDRTAPYSGPGFILYDSVTLKLAATTYTITSTVTYNNGKNSVTAGIIAIPGARLIGASTSTNHGSIITAGNGLNADLIATSTVGTGIAAAAQWWHWGGFENLRVMGNGSHQTAGNCFNIENMGETAFLRTIEVSDCYLDNILVTGASATPSDIANITTNGAGRYGFNFNNLAGVAVVHGLSGDSNTTSLVRLNGGQSGTLTILGFKAEEEISGQDPLITIDQTGQATSSPGLFIVGGYTFGRNGVTDLVRYINGAVGTFPFVSIHNFYVQNYVNALNDTVNNFIYPASAANKIPFWYGGNGAFYGGQAFTLGLNTFVQAPHSGNNILTEIFGNTSSNETLVAASGTSTDVSIGGIGFRMPNRSVYGQTPELFAKMTYAFPGGVPNPQQWEFIPVKVSGDNSTRWIGDPSYRWDEIYSADVNSTTATVGTLNVTTCNGCGGSFQQVNSDWSAGSGVAQILNKPALATVATSGSYNDLSNKPALSGTGACGANQFEISDNVGAPPNCAQVQYSQLGGTPTTSHLVSGSMQGNTATLTGNSADQALYTATLPAGTFTVGTGAHCWAKWQHTVNGSTSITYKWTLGSSTVAYAGFTSASQSVSSDIEVLTPASLTAQIINLSAVIAGNGFQAGQSYGNAGSENLANADTIKLTFNAGSGEQVKGMSFYCQTIQ